MHRNHSKIVVPACLTHKAGNRLIEALSAWQSDLVLESEKDLSSIVTRLQTPYDDAVAMLLITRGLGAPPVWVQLRRELELALSEVAKQVLNKWNTKKASGKFATLVKQWKNKNPLKDIADSLEDWNRRMMEEWLKSASEIVSCCLPIPLPEDELEFFIASSSEGVEVAEALLKGILSLHPRWKPCFWKAPAIFIPGTSTLDSLEKLIGGCHFGVYVLTADDKLEIRSKTTVTPRGNVIFEMGMGVGIHGPQKSFIIHDKVDTISDLNGITTIPYAAPPVAAAASPAPTSVAVPGTVGTVPVARVVHPAPAPAEVSRIAGELSLHVARQIRESRKAWQQ